MTASESTPAEGQSADGGTERQQKRRRELLSVFCGNADLVVDHASVSVEDGPEEFVERMRQAELLAGTLADAAERAILEHTDGGEPPE